MSSKLKDSGDVPALPVHPEYIINSNVSSSLTLLVSLTKLVTIDVFIDTICWLFKSSPAAPQPTAAE